MANADKVCWTTDGLADSASDHQVRFNALAPTGAMPSLVGVSPDGQYASIFRDDPAPGWVARHNYDTAGYQAEFNQLVGQGLMPISVQAGGVGQGLVLRPSSPGLPTGCGQAGSRQQGQPPSPRSTRSCGKR